MAGDVQKDLDGLLAGIQQQAAGSLWTWIDTEALRIRFGWSVDEIVTALDTLARRRLVVRRGAVDAAPQVKLTASGLRELVPGTGWDVAASRVQHGAHQLLAALGRHRADTPQWVSTAPIRDEHGWSLDQVLSYATLLESDGLVEVRWLPGAAPQVQLRRCRRRW